MSIGEALSAARNRAGISIEQVSKLTRVRQTLVRQIEGDDFSQCGGAVYARGHIRSIAHVVGIDSEPLIAEFDRGHQPPVTDPGLPAKPLEPEAVRATPRGPNWGAAMVVALAVVCAWGLVQLFTPQSHRSPQTLAGPSVAASSAAAPSGSAPAAHPSTPPDETLASVPRGQVTVRLVGAKGDSWVQVTGTDRKLLFSGVLRKDEDKDFTDKKVIRLVVGNAGAVRLVVNGKDLGAPGVMGAVAHGRFGPGDPQLGAG